MVMVRRLARKKAASTHCLHQAISLSRSQPPSPLVAVHGHPLRAAAHLALRRRADGPAAVALGAVLLERQQLLGAEGLVVDLRRRLDEVLEVGAEQEVAEVDEFAVVLVLDVDNAPPVLAATDLLAVDDDGLFRADDGEGDEALQEVSMCESGRRRRGTKTNLDLAVDGALLVVKLVIVVRVHLEVVEGKLLLDALLEGLALLEGQGVGLGDDGHDVDNVRQLLQHNNVDGLERVARGLDEEEAAVDARVLDVALALGRELLAQVGGVLILDVLDDGVPAAVIVDQVAIAGGVDNVEAQTHAVLLDDVRHGLDVGGRADHLVGVEAALGLDQVRGEDGVDQCRLAETGLACNATTRRMSILGPANSGVVTRAGGLTAASVERGRQGGRGEGEAKGRGAVRHEGDGNGITDQRR